MKEEETVFSRQCTSVDSGRTYNVISLYFSLRWMRPTCLYPQLADATFNYHYSNRQEVLHRLQ